MMSVMIALGPGLTMAMSSLALFVVYAGFGRTRHAILWAIGCALGALQWGVMAAQGLAGLPQLGTGPAVDLLQILSLLAIVGGFGVRARGRVSWLLPMASAMAFSVILVFFVLPAPPIRAMVTPLLGAGLLGHAALGVPSSRVTTASAAEAAVVAVLLTTALMHAGAFVAAAAEAIGIIHGHHVYQSIYLFMAEPACAAVALAALLLIASDFSAELQRLLHTDPLTGVLNRAGFDYAIARLWARARPLAIAVADIDRFKQINDRFGHQVGDGALSGVAQRLNAEVARDGLVARLGGEEFAILWPGLDGASALDRIEAIRFGLAALRVENEPALRLSASFGVTERQPGETTGDLMERADRALYRSKRDGRNRSTLDLAEPATA